MPRLLQRSYTGSSSHKAAISNAYLTGSSATLSPGSGSFTFAFWMKVAIWSPSLTRTIAQYDANNYIGGWMLSQFGPNIISVYVNSAGAITDGSNTFMIPDFGWHRYVLVCDSVAHTVKMYRDGALLPGFPISNTWGALTANAPLSIGQSNQFNGFDGNLADVCYDVGTAWSATQVSDDYFRNVQPSTITHRWLLNEGAGTTAYASVSNLNITLGGIAAFSADSPMIARGIVRNFAAYSERVDLAPWGLVTATAPAYGGTLPTGVGGMRVLTDSTDGSPSVHYTRQSSMAGTPSSSVVIFSAYVKAVAGSNWLAFGGNGGSNVSYFNASTGVVGTGGGGPNFISRGSELQPDGSFRVWHMFTSDGTSSVSIYTASADGTVTYTGSGANQIAIGGVQVEVAKPGQTTPSPYVATGATPLSVYGTSRPAQNLLLWSEDVSKSAIWAGVSGCTTNTNGDIIEDTTSGRHRFYQRITLPAQSIPYVYSARVTPGTRRYAYFTVNDGANTQAWFDMQTGATFAQSGVNAWMIPVAGTTSYDCYASCTPVVSVTHGFSFGADTTTLGAANYTGINGQVAMSFSRMQVAVGSTPSEYVKTTSSAINTGAPRNQRQPQNLIKWSKDFSQSPWAKQNGAAALANQTIAPDGTNTASSITGSGTTSYVTQATTSGAFGTNIAGVPFTFSVWLKADSGCSTNINIADVTDGTPTVNKTVSLTTSWQQFSVTMTTVSPGAGSVGVFIGDGISSFPAGRTLFVWGAQLEQANATGEYIETTSAAINTLAPRNQNSGLQNILTYSNFNSAGWVAGVGGSIASNSVIAPDGTLTASAYTFASSTAAFAYLSQITAGFDASGNYTFSVWLKSPTVTKTANMVVSDVGAISSTSPLITVTTDWQRFTYSVAKGALTKTVYGIGVGFSKGTFATGDVIHCWGAQLVQSDQPGDYVSTGATAINIAAPRKVA